MDVTYQSQYDDVVSLHASDKPVSIHGCSYQSQYDDVVSLHKVRDTNTQVMLMESEILLPPSRMRLVSHDGAARRRPGLTLSNKNKLIARFSIKQMSIDIIFTKHKNEKISK